MGGPCLLRALSLEPPGRSVSFPPLLASSLLVCEGRTLGPGRGLLALMTSWGSIHSAKRDPTTPLHARSRKTGSIASSLPSPPWPPRPLSWGPRDCGAVLRLRVMNPPALGTAQLAPSHPHPFAWRRTFLGPVGRGQASVSKPLVSSLGPAPREEVLGGTPWTCGV